MQEEQYIYRCTNEYISLSNDGGLLGLFIPLAGIQCNKNATPVFPQQLMQKDEVLHIYQMIERRQVGT